MKLRVKFSKNGPIKFIGHLDVMRYFQKAIRRADIDIAYSMGFSPHHIMSFAAPLGVGLESDGEYMDIEVNSAPSAKWIMDSLNAVMNEGIKIVNVKALPENAKNAMASVAASRYLISFREGSEPDIDLEKAVNLFLSQKQILITKQTKKSELEFDIRPGIYEMKIVNGQIELFVDSSSSGNIKPAMVVQELLRENGAIWDDFMIRVRRLDTYTNIGNDTEMNLVPMDRVGDDF